MSSNRERGVVVASWAAAALFMIAGGLTGCVHHLDETEVVDAHSKGEGVQRGYDADEGEMWKATRVAIHWVGADHVDEHRAEHYLVGSTGEDLVS